MKPIEKIKQGILNANWILVSEAYEELTGEIVQSPLENLSVPVAKTVMKQRPNLFETRFPEHNQMYTEEKVSVNPNMGTNDTNRAPRRPQSRKVKATCNKCGKTDLVAPQLAPQMVDGELTKYVCSRH